MVRLCSYRFASGPCSIRCSVGRLKRFLARRRGDAEKTPAMKLDGPKCLWNFSAPQRLRARNLFNQPISGPIGPITSKPPQIPLSEDPFQLNSTRPGDDEDDAKLRTKRCPPILPNPHRPLILRPARRSPCAPAGFCGLAWKGESSPPSWGFSAVR